MCSVSKPPSRIPIPRPRSQEVRSVELGPSPCRPEQEGEKAPSVFLQPRSEVAALRRLGALRRRSHRRRAGARRPARPVQRLVSRPSSSPSSRSSSWSSWPGRTDARTAFSRFAMFRPVIDTEKASTPASSGRCIISMRGAHPQKRPKMRTERQKVRFHPQIKPKLRTKADARS